MEIRITTAPDQQKKMIPNDESSLGFGNYFTDHIFLMDYEEGKGWFDPRIEPYDNLKLDPAATCLHYGQEIFEGLKAYLSADEGIHLFRPEENFKRLNRSAVRLCMPKVDIELALAGLKQLVLQDRSDLAARHEPHVGVEVLGVLAGLRSPAR